MRVLLISANTEKLPDPVFALGAAYMAAAAVERGHEVDTLDLCFLDTPGAVLEAKLRDFAPEVVGISLRNLDSSSYPQTTSYIDDYKALVDGVRASSAAPIVLGGSGFTVMPGPIMEYLHADVGVIGEGELAFPWLLDRLAASAPLASTPEYRCETVDGGVCVTPVTRIKRLDLAGVPGRERFDLQGYYERGGALNIQ